MMTMIDPEYLAFDIDGVIADTMQLFIDILRDHYQIDSVRYEDITAYRLDQCLDLDEKVLEGALKQILNGGYQVTLKAIPGAGSVLRRIGKTTGRILMVTARSEPGPLDDWMSNLLDGQYSSAKIVATGSHEHKTEILLAHGVRWFIEDRPETCELIKAAGIEPILFRQPWNRESMDFLHVESWLELQQKIAFP